MSNAVRQKLAIENTMKEMQKESKRDKAILQRMQKANNKAKRQQAKIRMKYRRLYKKYLGIQQEMKTTQNKHRATVDNLKKEIAHLYDTIDRLENENKHMKKENDQHTKLPIVNTITREGHVYTDNIRQLYYSLLAQQIAPERIARVIKLVLQIFTGDHIDIKNMELPKRALANKMRKDELPTVSYAQQGALLSTQESANLSTDGTTIHPKGDWNTYKW